MVSILSIVDLWPLLDACHSLGSMVLYRLLVPWFGMSSSLGSVKFMGISWDGRNNLISSDTFYYNDMKLNRTLIMQRFINKSYRKCTLDTENKGIGNLWFKFKTVWYVRWTRRAASPCCWRGHGAAASSAAGWRSSGTPSLPTLWGSPRQRWGAPQSREPTCPTPGTRGNHVWRPTGEDNMMVELDKSTLSSLVKLEPGNRSFQTWDLVPQIPHEDQRVQFFVVSQ